MIRTFSEPYHRTPQSIIYIYIISSITMIMYNVELMHYLYKQQVQPLQPLQQPRHQTGPSPHHPLPLDL